jgi:F-type H+-transporting ATPase subunit b
MRKVWMLLLLISPIAIFASSGEAGEVETDIVQRVVNFAIFASILYYLLADKVKDFFESRVVSIRSDLEKVQTVLEESKKRREEALKKVEDAKSIAKDIIETANKDVAVIQSRSEESLKVDLVNLERQYSDKMELETKRVQREVVQEVLDSIFGDMKLTKGELMNIITKKVA